MENAVNQNIVQFVKQNRRFETTRDEGDMTVRWGCGCLSKINKEISL